MANIKRFIHTLSEILVAHQILSELQAHDFECVFKKSSIEEFDDFILSQGLATKDLVLEALSAYYEVPFFDVEGFFFDTSLLRAFPKDFLLRNAAIPVRTDNDMLLVITDNPKQEGLASEMMKFTSYDIEFYVGIRRHICDAIKEFYDRSYTDISPIDT